MARSLELLYFGREDGLSIWRLATQNERRINFPKSWVLMKFFKKADLEIIERRRDNFSVTLLTTVGTQKKQREEVLGWLEKYMRRNHTLR